MLLTLIALSLVDGAGAAVPWEAIGGGSAAVLIAGLFIWTLRHSAAQHKECNEAIGKIATDFTDTVKEQSTTFATTVKEQQQAYSESTNRMLEDARQSREKRDADLHDLLRKHIQGD